MVPIYLRAIGAEVYGAWLATGQMLTWITVLDPGLSTVIQQRVGATYGSGFKRGLSATLGVSLLSGLFIALCAFGVGFALSTQHLSIIGLADAPFAPAIELGFLLAVGGTALLLFGYGVGSANQGLLGTAANGAIDFGSQALGLGTAVWMLVEGWGVVALGGQVLVRGLFYAALSTAYLLRRMVQEHIRPRLDWSVIKEIGRTTAYTAGARMSGILAQNIDVVLVARYLGPSEAAALELSRRGPQLAQMVGERPSASLMPGLAYSGSRYDAKMAAIVESGVKGMALVGACITGGIIAFNAEFVRLWVGPQHYVGRGVNLVIAAGVGISIAVISMLNFNMALGRIRSTTVLATMQALLSGVLVFVLVPSLGLYGAVLGVVISRMAVQVWSYPRILKARLRRQSEKSVQFGSAYLPAVMIVAIGLTIAQVSLRGLLALGLAVVAYLLACVFVVTLTMRDEIRALFPGRRRETTDDEPVLGPEEAVRRWRRWRRRRRG